MFSSDAQNPGGLISSFAEEDDAVKFNNSYKELDIAANLLNYLNVSQNTVHEDGHGHDIIIVSGDESIHFSVTNILERENYQCYHIPLLNELRGGCLHGLS